MFETPYKVVSYLLNQPSLSIGPYEADHSIMFSDVTCEIINFVRFDKLISSNENPLSSYYYQNIWKKIYDESISTKKIMDYVSRIDSLRFDMEKLRSKSFEYEPSKRVFSKSFAGGDELSGGTTASMRSSKQGLSEEVEVLGSPSDSTSSLTNHKTTVFKKSDSQDISSGYGTLV
ncbi:hypothetical protein RF11_07299 [Thelohanellus kitauei]|uniref:Uncharacterized protein n=1 Tax=Thelohanellus kitauei TaxID=669202 RepID=A0A0C2N735_THEKT|nr:hypothetical protein RF11_07299 [Thelohanellus kitauei]